MQTSVRGCSDRARRRSVAKGFTLLELLVVMVIISLGIAVTVISLRPDTRGIVREEGARLAALLVLASEESESGGPPLAWMGNEQGYQFLARELTDQGPDWSTIRGDDLLHPRQLPAGATIRSIRLDGQAIEFGQRVPLGRQAPHDLAVELALGEDRVRVTGKAGRFESAPVAEGGT